MSNNLTNQPMYVQSGNLETENIPISTGAVDPYPGTLGSQVTVNSPTGASGTQPGKTYKRIQVDSTVTTAPFPGAVAWWSNKARSLVTTSPTATNRGRIAGVFTNAIGAGNIGFIQTKGPHAGVMFVDAPTAAPSGTTLTFVIPSATAGKADAVTTAPVYPTLGICTGPIAGGTGRAPVDLDVPETP